MNKLLLSMLTFGFVIPATYGMESGERVASAKALKAKIDEYRKQGVSDGQIQINLRQSLENMSYKQIWEHFDQATSLKIDLVPAVCLQTMVLQYENASDQERQKLRAQFKELSLEKQKIFAKYFMYRSGMDLLLLNQNEKTITISAEKGFTYLNEEESRRAQKQIASRKYAYSVGGDWKYEIKSLCWGEKALIFKDLRSYVNTVWFDKDLIVENKWTARLGGDGNSSHVVAISPDDKYFMSAIDKTILQDLIGVQRAKYPPLLLLEEKKFAGPFKESHKSNVTSLCWSPIKEDMKVASGSLDKTVRIWDANTKDCLRTLQHESEVYSVAWSKDDKIASGCHDNLIYIWDASTGKMIKILQGHTKFVTSVSWSPDTQYLASASDDGTVRIWNIQAGECQVLEGMNAGPINAVAWNPNGQTVAFACDDGTVRIWNVRKHKFIETVRRHSWGVLTLCWSPDGKRLASAGRDKMLVIRVVDEDSECETYFNDLSLEQALLIFEYCQAVQNDQEWHWTEDCRRSIGLSLPQAVRHFMNVPEEAPKTKAPCAGMCITM